MTGTHTRTHVFVDLANPYLTCDTCGKWVTGWHDPQQCGCDDTGWLNTPCGHQAGITTVCPSWDPVDGCVCASGGGLASHGQPPRLRGNLTGGGR